MARPASRSSTPLSPRMQRLLGEARALLVGCAALFLTAILLTHNAADPGFSTTGDGGALHNFGGRFGAWLSDLLLLLFGMSAWWWVVLAAAYVVHTFRHLEEAPLASGRQRWVRLGGFALLLVGSGGIEWLRTWHWAVTLPDAHGGALGAAVGAAAGTLLGFTGGSLVLLLMMAVGFSLFTGTSWLTMAERTGAAVEWSWWKAIDTWQARRDRKLGEMAVQKREAKLTVEKKKRVEAPPIRIEPVVKAVPQSERAVTEKQAPLFSDLPDSPLPPLHLLDPADEAVETASPEALEFTSLMIERKLAEFGVEVKVVSASPGPVITRYEIEPATGVKGSQIVNLAKDLARTLSVISIRVVEAIPGKHTMGLEIPNPKRQIVRLSEILGSKAYHDSASPLTVTLGKDIAGNPMVADLGKMPHLLVAGTTGSGKSVGVNAMILSLVYKSDPSTVRMIMVDPKMLELSIYEGIPHLLAPVVTDMKQAASALNWCVAEMERRYKLMSAVGVRNLAGYNQKVRDAKKAGTPLTHPFSLTPDNPEPLETLPTIVVVIDELADLMMVVGKKVEELIARLAQKARAAGIHLILATQRPSVDVITGLIKANIPTRIAFQVSSKIDSRTILDQMGAEALLGQGDMLYLPPGTGLPQRVHGAFVSDNEVHRVVDYLKSLGEPDYVEGVLESPEEDGEGGEFGEPGAEADPLYDQAVAYVLKSRRASISSVQRQLRIGYNRAARMIEDMERAGLVSAMQSNGNRDVLAPSGES
ncbi:DNA translocase FtsK [Thiobacillus sedimenti]|uniref:DNA translocase FtsK 4TM domain-containing protein n=1 Tax=Thiobacillus sedimenti TaxID=3110231 RepID=A0ABZ1CJA0_9PROT|nr:DNA translocase FtsK 4TM domain-containing protein [Thiobacillus sp. SCUT-2]WRS38013.1 DNA translocase FtsK 4TM domain-containing protein [Thiobacillus sp. SCUT-2]